MFVVVVHLFVYLFFFWRPGDIGIENESCGKYPK